MADSIRLGPDTREIYIAKSHAASKTKTELQFPKENLSLMIPGIFLLFLSSLLIGFLGRHKKMGFWGYFFGSMVLTPIVGLVVVLASDSSYEHSQTR